MLTEKDYCDYETCVALKELGYKESCFGHYFNAEFYIDMPPKYYQSDRYVSAPILYEAQKWLREEKNAIIVVCPYTYNIVDETHTWTCELWFGDNLEIEIHDFNFYEEALSEGIKEAVKILKEK